MQEESYKRFFEQLPEVAPPPGLNEAVLARIERTKKHSARRWCIGMSALAASSFAALIPAFRYAAEEGYRSGSYHYLSLLFSDSGVVLASWREFTLTLAESLPLLQASVFLGTLFVLLTSFRSALKNMPAAFLSTRYGLR